QRIEEARRRPGQRMSVPLTGLDECRRGSGRQIACRQTIAVKKGNIGLLGALPAASGPAGAATVTINGAQTYQTIDGFGVNANSGNWVNNDVQPVVDALIDQAGMTLFLAEFVGNDNWETANANPGASLTNWTYFNSVYSGPNFQQLWGMMAHLNQRGITN